MISRKKLLNGGKRHMMASELYYSVSELVVHSSIRTQYICRVLESGVASHTGIFPLFKLPLLSIESTIVSSERTKYKSANADDLTIRWVLSSFKNLSKRLTKKNN